MNDEIKYGCLFLFLSIVTLLWLIIGKPTHPLKNYFLKAYLLGIFGIILGVYLIITGILNK
jgi:hypothetical protein